MMEISAGKIGLMEAFRTQKTKEYYADDVTSVHLRAAMRKGIELGGIQLMELNDIINPITRKMKRVSRLMDDMGKSPTALWRYDYSDADGFDQVDLFLLMEPRGNPRHPALR